jgi:hypothetical protein
MRLTREQILQLTSEQEYAFLRRIPAYEQTLLLTGMSETLLRHLGNYIGLHIQGLCAQPPSKHRLISIYLYRLEQASTWQEFLSYLYKITRTEDPDNVLREVLYRLGKAIFCQDDRLAYMGSTGSVSSQEYLQRYDRAVKDLVVLSCHHLLPIFRADNMSLQLLHQQRLTQESNDTTDNQRWVRVLERQSDIFRDSDERFSYFLEQLENQHQHTAWARDFNFKADVAQSHHASVLETIDSIVNNFCRVNEAALTVFRPQHQCPAYNALLQRFINSEIKLRYTQFVFDLLFFYDQYYSGQCTAEQGLDTGLAYQLQALVFGDNLVTASVPLSIERYRTANARLAATQHYDFTFDASLKPLVKDDARALYWFKKIRLAAKDALKNLVFYYDKLEDAGQLTQQQRQAIIDYIANITARGSYQSKMITRYNFIMRHYDKPQISYAVLANLQAEEELRFIRAHGQYNLRHPALCPEDPFVAETFYLRSFCYLSAGYSNDLRVRGVLRVDSDFTTALSRLCQRHQVNVPLEPLVNTVALSAPSRLAVAPTLFATRPPVGDAAPLMRFWGVYALGLLLSVMLMYGSRAESRAQMSAVNLNFLLASGIYAMFGNVTNPSRVDKLSLSLHQFTLCLSKLPFIILLALTCTELYGAQDEKIEDILTASYSV